MRKPGHDDHPEPQSVDMLRKLGYESSDVSLPVLVKWIAFLFVFIGGTSLLTLLIYWVFVPSAAVDQSSAATVGKLPPGVPALQSHPKIDMKAFREQEEARFSTPGWVDKSKGIARVPVDTAMDEIIASGSLPKAEPGAGRIAPARGEDITGRVPNPATPGGGAAEAPAAGSIVPGMPNATVPGPQNEGPQVPNNPNVVPESGGATPNR
jgi:hypothetical protein